MLNVVLGSDNFRSAQDIHAELRAPGETVGLTTVYRHLALLTDEGQLDALQTADGELVYRRCHSEQHHHHVVCRQCGRGTEVELPDLERWAESTASDSATATSRTRSRSSACAPTAAPERRRLSPIRVPAWKSPASITVSPRWVSVRKR